MNAETFEKNARACGLKLGGPTAKTFLDDAMNAYKHAEREARMTGAEKTDRELMEAALESAKAKQKIRARVQSEDSAKAEKNAGEEVPVGDLVGDGKIRPGKVRVESAESFAKAIEAIGREYIVKLFPLKRKAFGMAPGEVDELEFVSGLFAGKNDSPLLAAWGELSELLRKEMNRAYGAEVVAKRDDWLIPQIHREGYLRELTLAGWVKRLNELGVRGADGQKIEEKHLEKSFEEIVSSGEHRGDGDIFRHRFLKFPNAEAWLKYHAEQGLDAFNVMQNHLTAQSHKIGLVQKFGSRPSRAVHNLLAGKPMHQQGEALRMLAHATGEINTFDPKWLTPATDNIDKAWRAVMSSAQGGRQLVRAVSMKASAIMVPGDIPQIMVRAGFFDLPGAKIWRALGEVTPFLNREENNRTMSRLGIVLTAQKHNLQNTTRMGGEVEARWINNLTQAMMTGSLFNRMVDWAESVNGNFQLASWSELLEKKAWGELSENARMNLAAQHSITESDWKSMQEEFLKGGGMELEWGGVKTRWIDHKQFSRANQGKFLAMLNREKDLASGNTDWHYGSALRAISGARRGTLLRESQEFSFMLMAHPFTTTFRNLIPAVSQAWAGPGGPRKAVMKYIMFSALGGYGIMQMRYYMKEGEFRPEPQNGSDLVSQTLGALAYGNTYGLMSDFFLAPYEWGAGGVPAIADSPFWGHFETARRLALRGGAELLDEAFYGGEDAIREREDAWWAGLGQLSGLWQVDMLFRRAAAESVLELREL